MNNKEWTALLRQSYATRPVRFPASGITISGDRKHAVVTLHHAAVIANMQEDKAAFEAWCLVLHHWCRVPVVTLAWEPFDAARCPAKPGVANCRLHYNRFLYRVQTFSSLFDWFVVGSPDLLARPWMDGGTPYLNVAGTTPPSRSRKKADGKRGELSEHELEEMLAESELFDTLMGYEREGWKKGRQFPVGLFSRRDYTHKDSIFPGKKGAIDLYCLHEDHLWLFELKAGDNIPMGTITELLFYTAVMRDLCRGQIGIGVRAGGAATPSRSAIRIEDVARARRITGVMLGHNLHPLLNDEALIAMLNSAATARWADGPSVRFRAGEIETDRHGTMIRFKGDRTALL